MPADSSIGLINYRNPHRRQLITNIICSRKVSLLSGRLALLDQISDRIGTP